MTRDFHFHGYYNHRALCLSYGEPHGTHFVFQKRNLRPGEIKQCTQETRRVTERLQRTMWLIQKNITRHVVNYIQNPQDENFPPWDSFFALSPEIKQSWTELIQGIPSGEWGWAADVSSLPSPGGHLDGFDPLSALLGGGCLQEIMNFMSRNDLKEVLFFTLLAWWKRKWMTVDMGSRKSTSFILPLQWINFLFFECSKKI